MTYVSLNSVKFNVDPIGNVSSSDFPALGNIEDCQAYAELVSDLFNILYPEYNF